jgi:excinuclease UvrABC nuclease subunit
MTVAVTESERKKLGYTGHYNNETGEFWPDPHAPYSWVVGDSTIPKTYEVRFGTDEDAVFGPFLTEHEASTFVALLNKSYINRECVWDSKGYFCQVCGDLSNKAIAEQEEEVRLHEIREREDYLV